jgi:hypothetical protein
MSKIIVEDITYELVDGSKFRNILGTYCLKISELKNNYESIHEYFFDKVLEINKKRYDLASSKGLIFNSPPKYDYYVDIKLLNSNQIINIGIKNDSAENQQIIYDFIKNNLINQI